MAEYEIQFATRYVRRQFEKAVGESVLKLLAEPITNSDDSYKRLKKRRGEEVTCQPDFGTITILFNRRNRRFAVIDHAEALTDVEMRDRFVEYGEESRDRTEGIPTRSLFGKGLRDVLFTQKFGNVKSIKDRKGYECKFRWKTKTGKEKPVVGIHSIPDQAVKEWREKWGINGNGTVVEFVLREGISKPLHGILAEKLENFYMLRLINKDSARHIKLISIYDSREESREIKYEFPKGEILSKEIFEFNFEDYPSIKVDAEIRRAEQDLTQAEVGYEDRQGGLLIIDENDAVLDLTLFKYDRPPDPYVSRLFGIVRLSGAGRIISNKLNQRRPEEILMETREGFNRKHLFYKELSKIMENWLVPVAEKERKMRQSEQDQLSDKTRKRHQKAFDKLNQLYKKLIGEAGPGLQLLGKDFRIPKGMEFITPSITVSVGKRYPAILLINSQDISDGTEVQVISQNVQIHAQPLKFKINHSAARNGVVAKFITIYGIKSSEVGKVVAKTQSYSAELDITVIEEEVYDPIDGIAFNPDHLYLKSGQRRRLNLYINVNKVPIGEKIEIQSENYESIKVITSDLITCSEEMKLSKDIAKAEILIEGHGIGQKGNIIARCNSFEGLAFIEVVSKLEGKLRGKTGGKFKGYRFDALHLKAPSYIDQEGYIIINTNDLTNKRYFGNEPIKAVERLPHCQMRLADLVLDECIQMIVAEALGRTLKIRFQDNPEVDIRNYVQEKKFEIGPEIHEYFVKRELLHLIIENKLDTTLRETIS